MFYLIQVDTVYAISNTQYAIQPGLGFFWVEAAEGAGKVGDKFINGIFKSPYTLAERRTICLNNLLNKRNEVINSGVTVNGNPYYTDDNSINLINQCLTMEGLGLTSVFPCDWILANGNILNVTYDDIKQVAIAISNKKQACYTNFINLGALINTSDNPESININEGWPQ